MTEAGTGPRQASDGGELVSNGSYVEPANGLLREVIDAHGGFASWHRAHRVRAVLSTGGLLFPMRTTRDVFRQTEVVVDLRSPRSELHSFPGPGETGFFEGDRVWIADGAGKVIAERRRPRAGFRGIRKQLHWDHLDSVYFAGYAVWNYLTTPYLLCRSDLRVQATAPCQDKGRLWRGLAVSFPEDLPTHNPDQAFYFDERGRLRRHDYHAEVVGPYAVAAHYCDDHQTFGSAVFPTRRRVVPRTAHGNALPFPTLVWIHVHEARLER